MANARRSWPHQGAPASPAALTLTPDGLLNSDRSLAGPLRRGTFGSVGPTARSIGSVAVRGASDFGMDLVTPRAMDHIGVSYQGAASPVSKRIRR